MQILGKIAQIVDQPVWECCLLDNRQMIVSFCSCERDYIIVKVCSQRVAVKLQTNESHFCMLSGTAK